MKDSRRLLLTLKRLLKFNGFNYRKIATSLAISEPTVKRLFSNGNISLDRLTQLAELIDMTLLESPSVTIVVRSLKETNFIV